MCGGFNLTPTESIKSVLRTGHSSGGSEFDSYGSIGYSLEQKLAVIKRIEI